MADIQIFSFKGAEVRAVMVDGAPQWVAIDVCSVLGIANHRDALARLDDDERDEVGLTDAIGREQVTATVNESGLYSLILSSRKKQAKEFKKWVTAEVLPSIRKTGSYALAPVSETDKLAATVNQLAGLLGGAVVEARSIAEGANAKADEAVERLAAVEEQVKQTDPREIEERMFTLHAIKKALVEGTKDRAKPITFREFWAGVGKAAKVASFQNRMGLTIEKMETAIDHARRWAFTEGVNPPSLFDQDGNGHAV